jgi:hypothetical protein
LHLINIARLSFKKVRQFVLDLDSDGDGVVSFEEWRTALMLAADPHAAFENNSEEIESSDPMPLVEPIPLDPNQPGDPSSIENTAGSKLPSIAKIPGITSCN